MRIGPDGTRPDLPIFTCLVTSTVRLCFAICVIFQAFGESGKEQTTFPPGLATHRCRNINFQPHRKMNITPDTKINSFLPHVLLWLSSFFWGRKEVDFIVENTIFQLEFPRTVGFRSALMDRECLCALCLTNHCYGCPKKETFRFRQPRFHRKAWYIFRRETTSSTCKKVTSTVMLDLDNMSPHFPGGERQLL